MTPSWLHLLKAGNAVIRRTRPEELLPVPCKVYRRLAAALHEKPFNSTEKRMRAARLLQRYGFTDVVIPGAGWVSVGHLAKAGWCP